MEYEDEFDYDAYFANKQQALMEQEEDPEEVAWKKVINRAVARGAHRVNWKVSLVNDNEEEAQIPRNSILLDSPGGSPPS